MLIKTRPGRVVNPDDFENLWDEFVAAVKVADPQSIYTTMGQEHLNAPLHELKERLQHIVVQRKARP